MPKVKLRTDAEYRAAKADPGQRREIRDNDPGAEGLALRISERGHKSWSLRYRLADGTMRRMTLGAFPALSVSRAREKAEAVKASVAGGEDPQAAKRRSQSQARAQEVRTFGDLARVYFEAVERGEWKPRGRRKAASTLAEERGVYRRHIEAELGHERPEDIDRPLCRRLLLAVARSAPIQGNRCRALLSQVFNFAIDQELIERSPVAGLAAPTAEKPRERVLTDPELKATWAALMAPEAHTVAQDSGEPVALQISRPVALAASLALLTLQRRGEVGGMRRDELDLEAATWTIRAERCKNRRAHLVPLAPAAVALIREALELADARRPAGQREPPQFVFPGHRDQGKPMTPQALSHAVADAFKAAGVKGARMHDLRRTGASIMASERLGISPFTVSQVLNHVTDSGGGSRTSSRHYIHMHAEPKRLALAAWAQLLARIVGDVEEAPNVRPMIGALA